ncbi:hypothetical protein F5X68DRAFT_204371 [Plectosphaerella plurivora]|uniref:ATP-grasp domain-containing protein n=1 Tax=Plectosphaerella plurivora TaxID=936078 RepID=A0A9P8VEV6_9PEZI|nr:hypothetical protein F5X68DRAFT_204371 [Plectosphaerella plurivora]
MRKSFSRPCAALLAPKVIQPAISFSRPGSSTMTRLMSSASARRNVKVAVLFQDIDPPVIDGSRKPRKPGGYRDSGADIAYTLSKSTDVEVLTPSSDPTPAKDEDWCFPDSEDGILAAIAKGATHLWANTILFASHPLQTSFRVGEHGQNLRVVGQGPLVVEKYDDKDFVNALLRRQGIFAMPSAWTLHLPKDTPQYDLYTYPVVGKPARGRGSHGVKVCPDAASLKAHIEALAAEGLNVIIVEQYLAGEEATVTVMPPADGNGYRALPVVARFNHHDGIAPYNGAVAVTANSRAVVGSEDPAYAKISRECERVAEFLGTTAPIRIDVRRFSEGSDFALFDVNMKPNMTGPGRPGRDDQASLTGIAAAALGWEYGELLAQILASATTLEALRGLKPQGALEEAAFGKGRSGQD